MTSSFSSTPHISPSIPAEGPETSPSITISHPGTDEDAADMGRLDPLAFRDAMARLGAAVSIVTTDGPGGRAGFAATAICSVSDDPPTLLVCLNRNSSAYSAVTRNGVICVNVLDASQADLSRLFGGRTPMDARFDAAGWKRNPSGTLELADALVTLDCRIHRTVDAGTHDVLFCHVTSGRTRGGGSALVYFDRAYHTL